MMVEINGVKFDVAHLNVQRCLCGYAVRAYLTPITYFDNEAAAMAFCELVRSRAEKVAGLDGGAVPLDLAGTGKSARGIATRMEATP
jgi:hypothetical protein